MVILEIEILSVSTHGMPAVPCMLAFDASLCLSWRQASWRTACALGPHAKSAATCASSSAAT